MRRLVSVGLSVLAVLAMGGGVSGLAAQSDQERLREGRAARAEGRYEEAAAIFAALARSGSDAAHTEHLVVLLEMGRYEDVVRAGPSAGTSDQVGVAHWRQGRLDQAEAEFHEVMAAGGPDSLVAALHLAQLQFDRGRRDDAMRRFDRFIDVYNRGRDFTSVQLTAIATAARYIGVRNPQLFRDAVRVYDEAIAADPGNVEARVALGDLLLEKYNNAEAREAFSEALARRPGHPGALLGMARSLHFDGQQGALENARKALETNPNSVPARVFLARLLLESEDYEAAREEAERALQVDAESPEALAVLAAAHHLTGDGPAFQRTAQRALQRNPRYADLYNTLADLSARNRLYHEGVRFARLAIQLDSLTWRGWGLLGLNQLRVGEIEAGRRSLERSFEGDPYNVWIKNTLDLADTFPEYQVVETERFRLVLHGDEAGVMGLYLGQLAEEAYDRLAQRYDYRPETPIRIEVYPRHADFSVRTVGLAGLGALGVSFGPVVAMDSPSAQEIGAFNWGATLWHELAHTFHLGMTDHRVPRWVSEGLAVHEERGAREGWGGDVSPGFLHAYRSGRLLPVSELNDGFVRPQYPEQIGHSYYQASLVFELIETEWGFAAIREMLMAFKDGASSGEAVTRVLGMSPSEFDQRFDEFFKQRFTGALVALGDPEEEGPPRNVSDAVRRADRAANDFRAQLRAGRALFEDGREEEAVSYLDRAQDLFPGYAGADSPYWYLATIYQERGALGQAAHQLARMIAINENHYAAHVLLADLQEAIGDTAAAAHTLTRALYVYPFDMAIHRRLAGLYEALEDWAAAATERRAVVALRPVDMAEARYRVAYALYRSGDSEAARREVLRALEVAPNYSDALDLLLTIRGTGASENFHGAGGHDA